jgi:RNA polymerase sigma-70 factor, ECF subfamily
MLVLAAQAGDQEAFSELFRRHYPTIRRACARKLRDLREADEIAQAAFVRAYERLDKCGGDRRFGAWVQVIANNLCIDHLRASARTTPVDEPIDEATSQPGHLPEDALLNAEQAALIQRALASLPDRQRDVVVARDVDGRRPPEIAAALGLSLGAVDSLLLRARRRLAASVQAMSAEGGAANLMTTAAVSTVAGTASQASALGKLVQVVGNAVATVSYNVAAAVGMVPGVPSLAQQVAPAAAAGLVSLAPAVGGGVHAPEVPSVPTVPAISATVPSTPDAPPVPASPSVLQPATTLDVPEVTVPQPLRPTDRAATPVPATPVVEETPGLLEQVGEGVSGVVSGLLGGGPAR